MEAGCIRWRPTRPPFDRIPSTERRRDNADGCRPSFVVESHFRGWTADGLVRQALRSRGCREDKPAKEVVTGGSQPCRVETRDVGTQRQGAKGNPDAREPPPPPTPVKAAVKAAPSRPRPKTGPEGRAKDRRQDRARRPGRAVAWGNTWRSTPSRGDDGDCPPHSSGTGSIGSTSASTKAGSWPITTYPRGHGTGWRPHVVGRPALSLVCAVRTGTKGQCFFQKHASAGLTEAQSAHRDGFRTGGRSSRSRASKDCCRWSRPACSRFMSAAR